MFFSGKVPTPIAVVGSAVVGVVAAPALAPIALGIVGLGALGPVGGTSGCPPALADISSHLMRSLAGGMVAVGQAVAMGAALPAQGIIGAAALAGYGGHRLVKAARPDDDPGRAEELDGLVSRVLSSVPFHSSFSCRSRARRRNLYVDCCFLSERLMLTYRLDRTCSEWREHSCKGRKILPLMIQNPASNTIHSEPFFVPSAAEPSSSTSNGG